MGTDTGTDEMETEVMDELGVGTETGIEEEPGVETDTGTEE